MIPQAIDKLVSDYNVEFAKRFPMMVAYAAKAEGAREWREDDRRMGIVWHDEQERSA